MNDNLINLDAPISEIIEAKKKYHIAQITFHKGQLELLTKAVNGKVHTTPTSHPISSTVHAPDFEIISQKNVKPFVWDFLKANKDRYTTDEILIGIKPEVVNDKALRAKWVQAISLSLNSLVTYKHVNAYAYKGRMKKYILKEYDNEIEI